MFFFVHRERWIYFFFNNKKKRFFCFPRRYESWKTKKNEDSWVSSSSVCFFHLHLKKPSGNVLIRLDKSLLSIYKFSHDESTFIFYKRSWMMMKMETWITVMKKEEKKKFKFSSSVKKKRMMVITMALTNMFFSTKK